MKDRALWERIDSVEFSEQKLDDPGFVVEGFCKHLEGRVMRVVSVHVHMIEMAL